MAAAVAPRSAFAGSDLRHSARNPADPARTEPNVSKKTPAETATLFGTVPYIQAKFRRPRRGRRNANTAAIVAAMTETGREVLVVRSDITAHVMGRRCLYLRAIDQLGGSPRRAEHIGMAC
jgi:hypothetical protein